MFTGIILISFRFRIMFSKCKIFWKYLIFWNHPLLQETGFLKVSFILGTKLIT